MTAIATDPRLQYSREREAVPVKFFLEVCNAFRLGFAFCGMNGNTGCGPAGTNSGHAGSHSDQVTIFMNRMLHDSTTTSNSTMAMAMAMAMVM